MARQVPQTQFHRIRLHSQQEATLQFPHHQLIQFDIRVIQLQRSRLNLRQIKNITDELQQQGIIVFDDADIFLFFLFFLGRRQYPRKPTIAFIGVRISWLILARKADFKRLDSSARSLAVVSSCSIFFRLVMTRDEPTSVNGFPSSSRASTAACAFPPTPPCADCFFCTLTMRYSSFHFFPPVLLSSPGRPVSPCSRSSFEDFLRNTENRAQIVVNLPPPVRQYSVLIGLLISHRIVLLFRSHFQGYNIGNIKSHSQLCCW